MGDRHYFRPRTTHGLKNRLVDLAEGLSDEDTEIRGFHDALTVVVEHLEENE